MVVSNTIGIMEMLTSFFKKSFEEIIQKGFDLNSLNTVKSVLSETHQKTLSTQIKELKEIENKVNEQLPSIGILQSF